VIDAAVLDTPGWGMETRRPIRKPASKFRAIRRGGKAEPRRHDTEARATTAGRIVYIVDADRDRRVHAARFLRKCGFQTEAFGSGDDFFGALSYLAPGCSLIASNPDNGAEIIPLIREMRPEMMSIMAAVNPTPREAVQALKEGAIDVLELPFDEKHLLAALDQAFLALPAHVAREHRRSEASNLIKTLTSRENDVFRAIAEGATNLQISAHLAISERTVEMHRAGVMRKLGMSNVAALTRFAVMTGVVKLD